MKLSRNGARVLTVALAAALGAAAARTAESQQSTKPSKPPAAKAGAADARVERGKYLVTTSVCTDCHTPKKWVAGRQDPVPLDGYFLAGHLETERLPAPPPISQAWIAAGSQDFTAWAGPWGVSYAMNLTPDANTGIGSWTEATFIAAMRTGKHMGVSRPILPPMPWQAYSQFTDDDLKSIYAYLKSIPAVKNRIHDPIPPPNAPGAPPAAAKPPGAKP